MSAARPVSVSGLLLAAALSTLPAGAETRPEIVERAFSTHGATVLDHAEVAFRQCSKSGCVAIRARFEGGLLEYEVREESGRRRARMDNDGITVWEHGERLDLPPERVQKMRDWVNEKVYFPFLPLRLRDASVIFQDQGLVDWNGETLHCVEVGFLDGTSTSDASRFLFWFDPDTARMTQFAYSFDDGLRLRRAVHFHPIGGLLFSDQENYGVDEPGETIDVIDPSWIAAEARHISTVRITDLRVRRLNPGSPDGR